MQLQNVCWNPSAPNQFPYNLLGFSGEHNKPELNTTRLTSQISIAHKLVSLCEGRNKNYLFFLDAKILLFFPFLWAYFIIILYLLADIEIRVFF